MYSPVRPTDTFCRGRSGENAAIQGETDREIVAALALLALAGTRSSLSPERRPTSSVVGWRHTAPREKIGLWLSKFGGCLSGAYNTVRRMREDSYKYTGNEPQRAALRAIEDRILAFFQRLQASNVVRRVLHLSSSLQWLMASLQQPDSEPRWVLAELTTWKKLFRDYYVTLVQAGAVVTLDGVLAECLKVVEEGFAMYTVSGSL